VAAVQVTWSQPTSNKKNPKIRLIGDIVLYLPKFKHSLEERSNRSLLSLLLLLQLSTNKLFMRNWLLEQVSFSRNRYRFELSDNSQSRTEPALSLLCSHKPHWIPLRRPGFEVGSGHVGSSDGHSGDSAGFLRVLRFPLPIFIPPTAPQSPSSIIRS
jgi:hypothetical protein